MSRPTALRIPSPWSGDENVPTPRRYWAWFWLYSRSRHVRHWLKLHDWTTGPDPSLRRCTWCGKREVRSCG